MKNLNKTLVEKFTAVTGEEVTNTYKVKELSLDMIIHTGTGDIQAYTTAYDKKDVTIVTDGETFEDLCNYRTEDIKKLVTETAKQFLNLNNNINYELNEVVYTWETEIFNHEWNMIDDEDPELELGCMEPVTIELILAE